MTKQLKSPLRYPGGKSKAIKYLKEYIPSHFDRYIEPFVGGGSMFLHVLQNYFHCTILLSDVNLGVSAFWDYIGSSFLHNEVNAFINKSQDGKHLFEICSSEISNPYSWTCTDKTGAAFYILNQITYSGIGTHFSETAYDRFIGNKKKKLDGLLEIGCAMYGRKNSRLNGIQICQNDYKSSLEYYRNVRGES